MAHFYVKNSLNYNKAVKIDISFVRGYGISANDGDPIWLLEVATTYPSISGTKIAPQYINRVNDATEMDALIAEAVANIAAQVDWSPLEEDRESPYVYEIFPSMSSGSVALESNVSITLKDPMASSGMDLSDVVITISINNTVFDITSECVIEGSPFEYLIYWAPPDRKYEYYGG